mmetsp:Transcript_17093/g.44188  ORF Transcript_17093/g.44188 Transcript_17093/m.44188 type:complete len:283 (-) Transcript_17093:84-932(-)
MMAAEPLREEDADALALNEVSVEASAPRKPTRVTPFLIAESAGIARSEDGTLLPADKLAEEVVQLKRLRLDRQNIQELDGLDCCERATHLYLQHNIIEAIDDSFLFMRGLRFLSLDHNRITHVANLRALKELQYLGLAHNLIEEVDTGEIPQSVQFLDLYGNPCSLSPAFRLTIIENLPALLELDQVPVLREEAAQPSCTSVGTEGTDDTRENSAGNEPGHTATATLDGIEGELADLYVSRLREGSSDVSGELESVHAKKDAIIARAKERRAMMRELKHIAP